MQKCRWIDPGTNSVSQATEQRANGHPSLRWRNSSASHQVYGFKPTLPYLTSLKTDVEPQPRLQETTNFGRFCGCLPCRRLSTRHNRQFALSERLPTPLRSGTISRIFRDQNAIFNLGTPSTVHALIFGLAVDADSKPIGSNGLRPCRTCARRQRQAIVVRKALHNSHLRCSSGFRGSGR